VEAVNLLHSESLNHIEDWAEENGIDRRADIQTEKSSNVRHFKWNNVVAESIWMSLRPVAVVIAASRRSTWSRAGSLGPRE
jgi:hypothetical protein